ncbi:glycosyltransferase family 2 protein [Granulicella cerasi]|uniref:Glycosyltransferase family 2 protein n=1 Tax=Granulicella cerasi TaxID=741063 RepID=A0ABW1ZE12_9BACT|nr:glycosyltransferase family 2 protein [Granulicella cerasi]
MPLLSVAIITLNEEENLGRTLASVAWADEIIVVDSGSTDRTVEIARSYGAQVIERCWPGFAAQKNFAIGQCSGTWVLSLDADEELSPELQHQVRMLLPTNPPVDAYYLKRRNLFLGRWIKRGGFYPDRKLRLFRRTAASFEATPQFEDRPVHEVIQFEGAIDTLDYDLVHHAYPTLSHYIEHMDRYSNMGAEIATSRGRELSKSYFRFFLGAFLVPHLKFLWTYFILLGFLDGREGLLLHLYHATYTSWKFTKTWERSRRIPSNPQRQAPNADVNAAAA